MADRMNKVQRTGAALACVVMLGTAAPLAQGSEAPASEPGAPSGVSPTNPTSYSPIPEDFSLTISPTRLVVSQTETDSVSEFLVVNRGRVAMPVTVQKRNFAGGSDGALLFQADAPYSAMEWVTIAPTNFVVEPGAAQVVTAAVAVGPDPEPGDHQVAVVFLVPAGRNGDNVSINRGMAAPVYVAAPGPVDNSTSVGEFTAPSFTTGGPVTISMTVDQTGTVHRDFRGATRLAVDSAGSSTPFPDFTVMRGSTRDISTVWDPPFMCVCHPAVSITAADGSVRTVSARVIVFPLDVFGIALAAALLLALGVVVWRRRRSPALADTGVDPPVGSDDAGKS